MTHATPRDTRDASRVAYLSLFVVTTGLAVVAFILSFHGLDDYGRRVAGFGRLSPLVPVAVDGMTLAAVAATTLLRRAPLRVRVYAWFVFGVAVALSIGGNLAHADASHLSLAGVLGAVGAPVLLASTSHLAIVTRRTLERQDEQRAAVESQRRVDEARRQAAEAAALRAERRASRAATPPRQRAATAGGTRASHGRDSVAERVRQMWTDGQSHAEIAMALGISKKTAERHTEPLRKPAPADDDEDRAAVTA